MKNIRLKHKIVILFFFIASLGLAQNKYKTSANDAVITKKMGNDTIASNQSLQENLSGIADFAQISKLYAMVNPESQYSNHQMVTIFTTKNEGFSHLDKKQLETFFDKSNIENLSKIALSHVIPGRVDAHAIKRAVEINGGTAVFKTLSGEQLTFKADESEKIYLVSPEGSKSYLIDTDYLHSKGYFHVISQLLYP